MMLLAIKQILFVYLTTVTDLNTLARGLGPSLSPHQEG